RELPVQYVDFAAWQREWLQSDSFREQLAYWKAQLSEPVAPLTLPVDHLRPATEAQSGATQFFSFPKSLAERLKALSAGEQTTLFMTVLAAFATLLHRYTGQVDIVIGSPFSGRDRVEIERLIGFFINTHALRFNLAGNPTFVEL